MINRGGDEGGDFSWLEPTAQQLNKTPPSILQDVSNCIKRFNSTPTEKLDLPYIAETIDWLTYYFFIIPYQASHPDSFWRTRLSEPDHLFPHTDELKYPPDSAVSAGRANFQGSPIFYAGSSPETTFAECRLNEGDHFHLTEYTVRDGSTFYLHVLGDIDSMRRRGKTVLDRPSFAKAYLYALDLLRDDVRMAVQLVDAFFVDRLSRKGGDAEYQVTASIVAELLKQEKLSGIIFPSVEHAGGFNYAIKPDCYDAHILPLNISAQKVLADYGYGAYQTARHGPVEINDVPGNIRWPDLPADWP